MKFFTDKYEECEVNIHHEETVLHQVEISEYCIYICLPPPYTELDNISSRLFLHRVPAPFPLC